MSIINNRTPIDNLGEKLNLYRETTESIEDFQNRVYVALSSLKKNKYSFRDSLDYITSSRSKKMFVINKPAGNTYPHLSFDGVFLKINDESIHIDEFKFVRDFIDKLVGKGLIIEYVMEESDIKFLKSSNILPFDTERMRINKVKLNTNLVSLNENNIRNIHDNRGDYKLSDQGSSPFDLGDSLEGWDLDGAHLRTENKTEDDISYNYSDYPLLISWSEFRYYTLNNDSFDYRIKNLDYVYKSDEQTEQPYLLKQEGAKLLNKIYKLSNTYWGK